MITRERLQALVRPFGRELCNAVFRDHTHFTSTSVLYIVISRDRDGHAFRWKKRLLQQYAAVHGTVPIDIARADALVGFLELDVALSVFREAAAALQDPRPKNKQSLVVASDEDGINVGCFPRFQTDEDLVREFKKRAATGTLHLAGVGTTTQARLGGQRVGPLMVLPPRRGRT